MPPTTVDRLPATVLYQGMRRARILGQYFTPQPVVELCYGMLRALDPDTENPLIVDPACGEGAFLSYALGHEITTPDRLFGIEKDPEVAAAWEHRDVGGLANLDIGDGLCMSVRPLAQSPPLPVAFDWVVGNPPFGTRCLATDPGSLGHFTISAGRQLDSYPVEILFLERFWQLARPGGYVAIIIPDGILANARLSYVREWLSGRAAVKAVVSLPQHTFQRTGAASKASILVFQRNRQDAQREGEAPAEPFCTDGRGSSGGSPSPRTRARIFMAALDSRSRLSDGISGLLRLFPHSAIRNPKSAIECPPWAVFTVRIHDPGDRLDPAYHHPRYAENLRVLRAMPDVVTFGELIEYTTYGQVGGREFAQSGVRYLTPANLVTTPEGFVVGVDIRSPERFVAPGSRNDPARSRLRKGDLLLSNSGVGCIGRPAVFCSDEPCNISQHVNLIRVKGIEPEYLAVYLQTKFARLQIHREKCGVGPCGLNFDRIRSILIPLPPEGVRREIVDGYLRLSTHSRESARLIPALVERLESIFAEGTYEP